MLEKLLQDARYAKVITHFITHEKIEQNDNDLSDILEMYPHEMDAVLYDLLDLGLIIITREIAMNRFYMLNACSDLLPDLRLLLNTMSEKGSLSETKLQIADEYFRTKISVALCPMCVLEAIAEEKKLTIREEGGYDIRMHYKCGYCGLRFCVTYQEKKLKKN